MLGRVISLAGSRQGARTFGFLVLRSESSYHQSIKELSDRLVEAQRPIRILDAVKWDDTIEAAFFEAGCKEQPPVDAGYYSQRPLPFNPGEKQRELHEISRGIVRRLGEFNPIGNIMRRMCHEYQMVVEMLAARGTDDFSRLSQYLYGSASDAFHAGDPTLADLGIAMSEALDNIDRSMQIEEEEKNITGEQAVEILQRHVRESFLGNDSDIRVKLSDGITADAAAGADYLKIRQDARFNQRDLRVLEAHELWVHVATTLNGANQPVCTFLSKGPPSSTVTQEGLAILVEVLTFASFPKRLRRITNRIRAIEMAEQGATFIDVYNFFREQGLGERESYQNSVRLFRGTTPTGGPFTKDLSYTKGFVLIYNYIQVAVRKGLLGRIPLLFCGKTTLEDMRTIAQLVDERLVAPPKYLPPQFADLHALCAWMCFSNFFSRLNAQRIESDFVTIL